MAITFSYEYAKGKLNISGLTFSNTYTITKTGEAYPMAISGITQTTSYSDYFLKAGVTYTFTVTDQSQVSSTSTQYVDYNDSFLINSNTKKNQQISIVFDENISSFKPVRKDVLLETIGSKYPFIIRNAAINYKNMEFAGNITCHMDIENISGFGASAYYSDYTSAVHIERNFRDWFEEWINDGYPKILKTPTEGMRIVRIHNVNFTPIRQLGRLIYTFSCSITEIADYTAENLKRYGFSSEVGTTSTYLYPTTTLFPGASLYPLGIA